MRKMLVLLFAIASTGNISCGSYMPVSQVTEKVYIGMTKDEFLKVAKKRAEADAMTKDYFVYRINEYNLDGIIVNSMFYYFNASDNKLYEVNAGKVMK
mgnify:CR=1 FL=1|tara:strand:- start:350 stop:643 length:294 start_codon:yes stop_codon:yes gene_type:complete